MRFRIHRGANEIGGNCIEVEAQNKSILLDLGLPLNAGTPDPRLLPPISGLIDGTNKNLLGIVISHPHSDHYGLLPTVHPSIPVYLGEGASRLLKAAGPFLPNDAIPQKIIVYRDREAFLIGPFKITPFLMDHSAYDAHALLVEADDHSLLYSGDFRGHGRKSSAFKKFLASGPRNIDALLMEGTTIGRKSTEKVLSEHDLEDQIFLSMQETKSLVFTCFSAQNVDRLVTVYRAVKRASRSFVIDLYTARIVDGLRLRSMPNPADPKSGFRVFLPMRQKARILRTKRFDLVEPYKGNRIFNSDIAKNMSRYVMLFRTSMLQDAEALSNLRDSKLIYSLWPGYLSRDKVDLRGWCDAHGISLEVHHTSGHASLDHLSQFANATQAKYVVPIHTIHPKEYSRLASNVSISGDGEWFNL